MKSLPNLLDTGSVTDEGSEDHVDVLFDAEFEVRLVLLGDGGQIGVGSGEVAALAGAQHA